MVRHTLNAGGKHEYIPKIVTTSSIVIRLADLQYQSRLRNGNDNWNASVAQNNDDLHCESTITSTN